MIYVDSGRCTGCGACLTVCPHEAIALVDDVAHIDQALCAGCELCLPVCPEHAILAVEEVNAPLAPLDVQRPARASAATSLAPRERPLLSRWAGRALPWLGAAAVYLGREALPRLADALLEAWDRRETAGDAGLQPHDTTPPTESGQPSGVRGGRHRRRSRRGRP